MYFLFHFLMRVSANSIAADGTPRIEASPLGPLSLPMCICKKKSTVQLLGDHAAYHAGHSLYLPGGYLHFNMTGTCLPPPGLEPTTAGLDGRGSNN